MREGAALAMNYLEAAVILRCGRQGLDDATGKAALRAADRFERRGLALLNHREKTRGFGEPRVSPR